MDRARRDTPEDRVRTSQLIQQLAAQRERKLQAATPSSTARTAAAGPPSDDVAAASSIPLPSSFDEEEEQEDDVTAAAPCADDTSAARSRLVRQDKKATTQPHHPASQTSTPAAGADHAEVDGLASLLQGVGISTAAAAHPSSTSSRAPALTARPAAHRATIRDSSSSGSGSEADDIEDADDADGEHSSSQHPPQQQCSRPAAGAGGQHRSRTAQASAAAGAGSDSEDSADVASVDSASSSGGRNSSSSQQTGAAASSAAAAAAAAAPALVLDGGFVLDGAVAGKLYPHQIHGVKWLWSLHRMGKGGILADDMGLGKTMQCSAFLAGALAASRGSTAGSTTSSSTSTSTSLTQASTAGPSAAGPSAAGPSAAAGRGGVSGTAAPVAVRALVVAPKTLLAHWEKELRVCGMGRATHSFYGSSEGERAAVLTTITRRGGVMLTTYGMVLHNAGQIMAGRGSAVARDLDEHEDEEDLLCPQPPPGRRILWDYIILDEGHKIKNARTQLAQRLREIRARVRVIISGTPVQNNLGELHALMEFATPGLLGSAKDFKTAYEKPINAGQDRSATLRVRELGAARAAELRQLVSPYILRREKKEVLGDGTGTTNTNSSSGGVSASTTSSSSEGSRVAGTSGAAGVVAAAAASSAAPRAAAASTAAAAAAGGGGAAGPAPMGRKSDLVVWLRLTPLQRHIYEAFLHSDAVKAALNSSKSPLAALTVLKKVCDHPALLSERATQLVVTAAAKPSRRKGLDTSASSSSSSNKQGGSKPKRRSSLDDFIVDDDDEEEYEEESGSSYDSDDSDSSSGGGGGRAAGGSKSAAAARAAVAASLDTFSEEFLSWATATGDGEDLERRLLSDVGARGTESSCKSLFVAALLDELVAKGHRTLVFSQSRVMLDILQAAVKARGWNFCRIDGSVIKAEARQAEVDRFQTAAGGPRGIPVFLLTTQVGGLGLTLTAADRVVIVDPSWNPATDNQSVDRAYRIGQSRDVVVYRLVTCGTVEEKIYRKQVFKGGLSKAGMEEGIQLRYFTHQELHELFKWDPEALAASETQQLLKQQHAPQLRALQAQQGQELNAHIGWVEGHPLCAGTSQHGLLFSCQDPEGRQLNISDPSLSTAVAAFQQGGGRFRDSGWHPRQGTGGSSSGGSSRGAGGGGGFWGSQGGAAGGGGGGMQPAAAALDEMMRSLHIGGGSSGGGGRGGGLSAAAARGGLMQHQQWGGAPAPQQQQQQRVQELTKSIKQLQAQVQSSTLDLQRLGPKLSDGGAKIAARRDSLQAELDKAHAELKQLDPQAAAAAALRPAAPAASGPGSIRQGSQAAGPSQQQQQPGEYGWGQAPPGPPQPPAQQQQQQQWQQQQWRQQQQPPPPPPRPQQPQQQQQQWPNALPLPPQGRPQQQQQQQPSAPPGGPGSSRQSLDQTQQQQQQRRPHPDVQTLDGRVPTVSELQQRKRVLKKALQHEDRLREQLSVQGRQHPADKQQQWRQMYNEYKEIKSVLQAVQEAEQQEARQDSSSGVIDLT